jgi:hypothetical protein
MMRATSTTSSGGFWTLGAIALTASLASAIQKPESVAQPVFDLEGLGRVGLVGDFNGISLYEYNTQTQSMSNGSQALLTQLPNGIFTSQGISDSAINAMCVYETKDGQQKGIVVGGNFTSLGGVEAKGIAIYDSGSNQVTAMKDFNGKVNALLCDKDTNRVYVGGQFSVNSSENAIAWEDGEWKVLPFEGFTGPVSTIARSNNNTILWGGNFDGLQNFSSPNVKDAQTLNIASSTISTEQTTGMAGFNDPTAITCTNDTSKQWLLGDGQRGSWTATFRFNMFPTKLRLINANFGGRSTESFRLTAFPLGGIMNLTYTDPATGQKKACTESCPLAAIDTAQDFSFVNVVGMKQIRLDILSFRGPGAGLSSVQLFQDEIFTYAISDLNEPDCAAGITRSASNSTGPWKERAAIPSGDSDYLEADIDSAELTNTLVTFEPHIQQKGRYQVLVFTPGCINDGSCATRGRFEVGGVVTKDGKQIPPKDLYQTNFYDKYDIIYDGTVDPASQGFRPTITIKPTPQQTLATVRLVAQKVQFKLIGEATGGAKNSASNSTSTGLNGVYEYDPASSETKDPMESRINQAGLKLNDNASISAIVVKDDITYLAGNFFAKDDNFQNFMMVDKNSDTLPDVPNGGLDKGVNTMVVMDDLIYVGGDFTRTKDGNPAGINYIASFDPSSKSWKALGGGVSGGSVNEIVPMSLNLTDGVVDALAVSGKFQKVRPDNSGNEIDAQGFSVWVPSKNQWLQDINGESISLSGVLSASVKSGSDNIYAGSMQSNMFSSSGAIFLFDSPKKTVDMVPSSLKFTAASALNSRKRSIQAMNTTGVNVGVFYKTGGTNLTILGGHFEAVAGSGTIKNFAIINHGKDDEVTGATTEFNEGSTVEAMKILDKKVYVGGALEGANSIGGIAIWDLDKQKIADTQPQPLSGGNATVFDISVRPNTKDIYVAGDFQSAGSLGCANLCIYQTDAGQWQDASNDNPGTIRAMKWLGKDRLIVAGDMKHNGTTANVVVYDAKQGRYLGIDADVTTILGPVTAIGLDSEKEDSFFITGRKAIDGSPYIQKLNNKTFVEISKFFPPEWK